MIHSERLASVLAAIETEQQAWRDLLMRLSADRTDRPSGHGQWTVIETFIHVAAWQEIALRIARDQARPDALYIGPDLGPGAALGINTDNFNAELLVTHQAWTSQQALAWSNQINADLRAALAILPDERLFSGPDSNQPCRWFALPAISHSREHREELEQFLMG